MLIRVLTGFGVDWLGFRAETWGLILIFYMYLLNLFRISYTYILVRTYFKLVCVL